MSTRTEGGVYRAMPPWRSWRNGAYVVIGAATAGWALGWLGVHLAHDQHPKWLLARVAGLAAMTLLTVVVALGLALAHPRGTVLRSLPRDALIKLHVSLVAFTGVFTALHVIVLAMDEYAGVGWAGLVLPLGAEYRPMPVTLGWIALYGGLAGALTARFAGQVGRAWLPIHRLSIVIYCAAWLHGVLAGTDSAALTVVYAGSLGVVVSIAVSRYWTAPVRTLAGSRTGQ